MTTKKEASKSTQSAAKDSAQAADQKRTAKADKLAKTAVVDNATREIPTGASAEVLAKQDDNDAHNPQIAGARPGGEAIGNTNPGVTQGDGSTDLDGNSVMEQLPEDSSYHD